MNWISYLALPIIAAAIGWFTNWIAVKMLFRPRKKIRFLFFEIQGIFPKRQHAVAEKIGQMVSKELLSMEDIKERISKPGNLESINKGIEAKIEDYLTKTFPERNPVMSMLMGKKTKQRLKDEFLKEVEDVTPEIINKYVENLEGEFDVAKIIRQRVSLLSPASLERLIMDVLKKEFQFIELIGAILGFLIGVVQVLLVIAST